jgi:NAD(P)-dependent dehydrogenase (short-subunit alcohol dehydrogenase family)
MDLGLTGKVALITGGASGLGKETAQTLIAEGAKVAVADFNAQALEETCAELRARGGECLSISLDVRDYAQCRKAVAETLEQFGDLHCLVNCAGVGGSMSFFAASEPDDWQDLLAINLLGVMHCCRAVTDHMIEKGRGKIVSIASEAGKANEKRMVVYGVTKGGVISLTRGLATELGRSNINVNAVCPGVTHTPMTSWINDEFETEASKFYPLGRLGVANDIAPMIAFLCSEQSSWITGQAFSISGGFGRS